MTLSVKHTFQSVIVDDAAASAAGEVLPSHWNAAHTLTGPVTPSDNLFNFNAAAAPATESGSVVQLVALDSSIARYEADSFGAIAAFTARRANGTGASPTALAANDQIGGFNFGGYYVTGGPGYATPKGSVQGFATENWTSTANGTKVVVSTTPNNSTTLTTAATFGQDQSLALVGPYSGSFAGASAAPAFALTGAWFANANTALALIQATGTTAFAGNANGTGFGVNAVTGWTGALCDFQIGGVSKFVLTTTATFTVNVTSTGTYTSSGNGFVCSVTGGGYTVGSTGAITWTSRATLTSPGTGSTQFGITDTTTAPVAQTLRVQSVITTADTAGADWTLRGSLATGSGVSGNIIVTTGVIGNAGSSGTQHTPGTVATFGPSSINATGSQTGTPALSIAQVWNNSAISTDGFAVRITNTASGGNANIFQLYAGGSGTTSLFRISIGGSAFASALDCSSSLSGGALGCSNSTASIYLRNGSTLLNSPATATLSLGNVAGAGAAVAQTLTVQGSSGNSAAAALFTIAGSDQSGTGTTGGGVTLRAGNTSGASGTRNGGALTLQGGTGASSGGAIIFQVAGTTSLATTLTLTAAGAVQLATAVPLAMASGTNQRAGNATLSGGTVTVSNTTVTANTVVMLTRKTSGGTIGTAITYTVSAATSFTINSDNILDTSTFSYVLIEVP